MKKWLIVDGYNLMYQMPRPRPDPPADLAGRRQRLLRLLDELAGTLAERVTVVFDGARAADQGAAPESPHVEIVFSPPDKTADTVIEQLVCGAKAPGEICVVTSDRPELDNITAAGAEAVSCAAFLEQLEQARERLEWQLARRKDRAPGFTLGDRFPG
jgi:predicted RNA-binding protein with PIN domain